MLYLLIFHKNLNLCICLKDYLMDFPGGAVVKNPPASAGDECSIPGSGRSPAEGNGNPHQYSCLENSMDRRAWRAMVHGVTKRWTQLSN